MDTIFKSIQNKLGEIPELKYIDEDWGQLSLYGKDIPVQWPCCLIDIRSGDFDNTGMDLKATPINRQNGILSVELIIGNLKLSNSSGKTPLSQKTNALTSYVLMDKIHEKIQGFNPVENAGKLIRKSYQSIKRDDGVIEKRVLYSFEIFNV